MLGELRVPVWLQMCADLWALLYVPGTKGHTMGSLPWRFFPPPKRSGTALGSYLQQGTAVAEVRKGESYAGRGQVGWTPPALVSQAPGSQKRGLHRTELCCFLALPHCLMDLPASALLGRCFGSKPPALWFPLAPGDTSEQD